ncbi:MAG: hypothetical protein WCC17_02925 [Candidatus Nitrosopolaris sp.]
MRHLTKDELLALLLSVVAVLIIISGIFGGWWALSSVLNYVPEVIMLSLIPLLLWGFRKRIGRALQTESTTPASSTDTIITGIKIDTGISENDKPIQEQEQAVDNGINHYKSRSELPPFKEMLAKASVTVDMSGL